MKINFALVTEDLEAVIHAMWDCEDCDWAQDGYPQLDDGESMAYEHATGLGHTVRAEIVTMRKISGKAK